MKNIALIGLIAIVGIAVMFTLNKGGSPTPTDDVAVNGLLDPCALGAPVSGIVAVAGDSQVYAGPSVTSGAIINQKATAALGQTHYQSVDQTQTVRRQCEEGDWTQMVVVTPDWLTNVSGWVPTSALRTIERTASGQRVYVDADFSWYDDTRPYREQIVRVVNKITRENDKCGSVDTGTVSLSPSQGSPSDPVFFITCGIGASAFNVWFRPGDAADGSSFAAIQPIGQSAAVSSCQAAAKAAANHPSSVSFEVFSTAYDAHPSGRASVQTKFKAKNSFNLELAFNIRCLFDGASMIETSIWEEGA